MRVLYVNQWGGLGGAEVSLLRVLEQLRRRNHQLTLACPPGHLAQEAQRLGAGVILVNLPSLKHFHHLSRQERQELAKAVAEADVVHAYSARAGWFVGPVCREIGVPMVWSVHDLFARPWQRLWLQLVAWRYAKAVVAYSQPLSRQFGNWLQSRVHLLPHGVDIETFRPLSPEEMCLIRQRFHSPPERGVVLHVGRLMPFKGQHLFLEVARRIVQNIYPPPVFWLAGDASMGDARYAQILRNASRAIEEAVRWLGFQRDIAPVVGAADILVHCSTRPEPFGLVTIEAMACETVVVSANQGAPTEIIENERTGFLTPPNDVSALTQVVSRLLSEPLLRKQVGRRARQVVAERYTLHKHIEALLQLYDSLR